MFWVRRGSQNRQDFLHHGGAGHRIDHRGIGIENGDLVLAVAAAHAGVVVVLGHDQVGRRAGVGRDHGSGHHGGRVVPAKRAGRLLLGQIAGEVQHPAAVIVRAAGAFEDAEVDVAVRSDGWRGGAGIRELGIAAGLGILEPYLGQRGQGGAVQLEQVAKTKIAAADGHIQFALVITEGWCGVHRDLGDARAGPRRRGSREPGAAAVGRQPGDAALEIERIGSHHLEAEIDVARAIRRQRRIDKDSRIETAVRVVGDVIESHLAGDARAIRVGRIDIIDGAARAREI